MTDKLYTVAGTSSHNGKTKVRFANDYVGRFKILTKNGHENINIIELPSEMNKADVCKFLQSNDKFQDEASQSAIAEFVVRNIKMSPASAPATPAPAVETKETEVA